MNGSSWRLSAIITVVLIATGAAYASEVSQQALSRGLIDFHAGHYAAALPSFEEAYRADPNSPYILYYLGVTRGHLLDLHGAISDLRDAIARQPDFPQAALELGIALFETHAYEDAIPWLEQAQRVPELDGEASLYLGRAELQLGRFARARGDLDRAVRLDAQAVPAHYYLGVAAFSVGDFDVASGEFSTVVAASPTSELGGQATAYLRLLRRYAFAASLSLEYDSNVMLAPDNDALKTAAGISDQSDGRATIEAGVDYALWRTRRVQLWASYHFSQSLQFRLTQFDLQDHQPLLQLLYDANPFQLGALASYDYYILQTDSFFQQPLGMTWADLAEGDIARSSVFFRFYYRDFFASPFKGVRNTYNYSPGVTQYFYLGKSDRYLWGEYRFDKEDPQTAAGLAFGYTGNQIGGGVGWDLPAQVAANAAYAYRHERYRSQSDGRRDNEDLVSVTVRRPLTDVLDVGCGFFADINNSTIGAFAYHRYVVSLTLAARF